jgi:hypothetical protein
LAYANSPDTFLEGTIRPNVHWRFTLIAPSRRLVCNILGRISAIFAGNIRTGAGAAATGDINPMDDSPARIVAAKNTDGRCRLLCNGHNLLGIEVSKLRSSLDIKIFRHGLSMFLQCCLIFPFGKFARFRSRFRPML